MSATAQSEEVSAAQTPEAPASVSSSADFLLDGALFTDSNLVIYDSGDLTEKVLETRVEQKLLVVERSVGVVTSIDPDGRVNGKTKEGFSLCYTGVEGAEVGAKIVSYFVYNPENDYVDDIVYRWDYVID